MCWGFSAPRCGSSSSSLCPETPLTPERPGEASQLGLGGSGGAGGFVWETSSSLPLPGLFLLKAEWFDGKSSNSGGQS